MVTCSNSNYNYENFVPDNFSNSNTAPFNQISDVLEDDKSMDCWPNHNSSVQDHVNEELSSNLHPEENFYDESPA